MTFLPAGARFNFRVVSTLPAADAWRPLDALVARWVLAHGGSPLLAEVAAWASLAEGQGDSALPLEAGANHHGMRVLSDEERAALAGEAMVTQAAADEEPATPFVLQHGNFYLRRNYMHEVAVATHLRRRRAAGRQVTQALVEADLDALFGSDRRPAVAAQRLAVGEVVGRRLFVLTGGPGTGKTTTVLRMLLALAREHQATHGAAPVVRISAPTGKAAQRLTESLRAGGRTATAAGLTAPWSALLDDVLRAEASTLHRLLGSRGARGGFAHHAGNPMAADIVIVDEASMVDLALLRVLLEGLREDAILVLVGDADQLTSVGTGSVLLDLVAAMEFDPRGDLVRLQHSFRANAELIPINAAVRRGEATAFKAAWSSAGPRALWRAAGTRQELGHCLATWCRELRTRLEASGAFAPLDTRDAGKVAAVFAALRRQQLLCARREGEFGAEQVNDAIEGQLRQATGQGASATWYPGRAVMITRNDYAYDLFNGDVGLCLRDLAGHLQVWFEAPAPASTSSASGTDGKPKAARFRHFAPDSLPAHQGAFATTVHKSQGSEYDRVAVLLPPDSDNAVLSRQLLYTALSRARERVELWGTDAALAAALATAVQRSAGLRQRLLD